MKKHAHLVRNSTIIIFLFVSVFFLWYTSQPTPPAVTITRVDTGDVESIIANTRAGTVKACRRARLAPTSGGQLKTLSVRKGSIVKQGDILFEIQNEVLHARLLLAEQESNATRAGAKEHCVLAEVAAHEADRLTKLFSQKLTSEENVDRATGEAKARKAACTAAQETVKVSAARHKVIQVELEHTIMHAPFDGIVAEVHGEVGEFVTPSPVGIATLPVVDLVDNTCLYVTAPIDEVDAPAVKPGMKARITLDAFRHHAFPGTIRRIAPYVLDIAKQARTVEIEVEFTNAIGTQPLLPGYSADTEIILETRTNAVRIPANAIFNIDHVLVYNPESRQLEDRQIKTGIGNWVTTEVLSGLKPGESIVTSARHERITDGVRVTLAPDPEKVTQKLSGNP